MFGSIGSGAIGANNLDIRESSAGSLGITAAVAYNATLNFDSATGAITVGATTATSASLTELSLGQMLIWSATAASAITNSLSSADLSISSTTDFAFVPHMEGTFYVDSTGALVLLASSVHSVTKAEYSAGSLQLAVSDTFANTYSRPSSANLSLQTADSFTVTIDTSTRGDLYISGTSLFSRGYVRTSAGELEIDASSVISRTSARRSVVPLELSATTVVDTRIYTNVAFDSVVELVLTVLEQQSGSLPRGAQQETERRRARQHAYLSEVRMGTMRPHAVDVEHVPGLPEEQATPKRPLGDLGRFLQEFGQRKVDYSFDSQTGTVSFWISTETEVSNPRTERARAEQLDEEDQLLLGLSENYLALDSGLTQRMLSSHARRQDIEQQDLDLLGLGEFN